MAFTGYSSIGINLLVSFLLACMLPVSGSYEHLGCFVDVSTNRDLYKSEITFPVGVMTVADCVKECASEGQPYAGLQAGRRCYCGPTYGKHGEASQTIECNYTCNGNTEYCGGVSANSIYYAVNTATDSKQARSLRKYEDPKSFELARETCVSHDGDLAVAKTTTTVDDIVALFQNVQLSSTERKAWIGLRKPPNNTTFHWVEYGVDYVAADIAAFWKTGEPSNNDYVLIDVDTGKFETAVGSLAYPFLCTDTGSPVASNDYPADTTGSEEQSTSNSTNTLALAIVLPLFVLCYGGSCLLYCVHKIYKNFKRSKRKRMLLQKEDSFTEFEPDTKPSTVDDSLTADDQPGGGFSNKTVPPYMKHDPWISKRASLLSEGPAEESQPEPSTPLSEQPPSPTAGSSRKVWGRAALASRSSMQSMGPVMSSRPTTSEGVRINMDESRDNTPPGTADSSAPPSYYQPGSFEKQAQKVRAERRRNRLLENALKEARERRAKDTGGTASRTSTATVRPKGSSSSMAFSDDDFSNLQEVPSSATSRSSITPIRVKPKNSLANFNENDNDPWQVNDNREKSSASPESGGELYDPTKMSIADIIKIKQMMKEKKRKKVRKILTT